ncbi:heavy metal-responsive transcriptional regulator [Pseudanabaena galeata UHCC 0370]|jgi:MerR family transcriptional regulator, copper efflux regulator|uniref:Heavy metal-responsive transcriptional regulator n=1 Tax=Pseudanabaena galeata UHCC 0370 TaxID=3110310 RepID=A0ABU5TG17_9CYAN|nr:MULTISPECIES: heavy metal-responsive transcriptional regulator [Pseudanabaena]MEA5477204.1 heavy metal-responsive transcriptional regulator [Pseudanabaena galeata UHCC 0370]MEA5486472.1 heavy metal-responsive transcriptional regulator [Pseudanabaena sp. CCNP1317]WGS72735.1 heavy metal-responsive transcriptional regulator [Pseudanabaena galeata CCNP1313]
MVDTLSQTQNKDQLLLQIGQVAVQSQVPIKTIRYYEELGLLKSSERTEGGFRLFAPNTIARIAFIKRLQKLGLSLQEIAEILKVHDRGLAPCAEIKQQLEHQILEIDRRVTELMTLRGEISALLDDWTPTAKSATEEICPILQQQ